MVALKRQHKVYWLLLFITIRAASAASTRHFTLVEYVGREPEHPGSHMKGCDDDTHIDTAFHSAGVSADTIFASLLNTHPLPATAAIVEVGVYDGHQCAAGSAAGFYPVICFEPSPTNFDRSHATLEAAGLLGRVSLIKKALGDKANQIVKLHSKGGSGEGHLGDTPFTGEVEHGFQANEVITMESTSLDAHMRELDYNGVIYIVKIDTQGFDGLVIEGMRGLLADGRIDYVLFELWPKAMLHGGRKSCNETLTFLREFGFRLYELAMPGLSSELGEAAPDLKASLYHRGSSIREVCDWYESKDLSNSFGIWTDVLAVSPRRSVG